MKAGEEYSPEIKAQRVAYLVAGFINQRLTEKEHDELDAWLTESDANQALFEELIQPEFADEGIKAMEGVDTNAAYERIRNKMAFTKKMPSRKDKLKMFYRVAAAVVLIAGISILYIVMKGKDQSAPIAKEVAMIQPGGNHAQLTLGDGRIISLDNQKTGLIDSTNGSDVIKAADGVLSYVDNGKVSTEMHTLSTPKGGQYQVTLPDGSMVWLNAASSLKYPVHFSDTGRVVELTGEGYFEVAKQIKNEQLKINDEEGGRIPFKVKIGDVTVEVLGTHFNVNGYTDEDGVRTTLLEGSVRMKTTDDRRQTTGMDDIVLKPGEQGVLRQAQHDKFEVISNIDLNDVVAWQKGEFSFKDVSIETIMRQAARWYDIDVVYEGSITRHFNGEVLRKEPIDKLLHLLELTGGVHFKIEGKKVIVMP